MKKKIVSIAISMLLILSVCILTVPVKAVEPSVTIYASPDTHETILNTKFIFTVTTLGPWGDNLQYTWSIINADGSSGSWSSGWPLFPEQISSKAVMLGTHTISVTVTDENGTSASDSYSLTVHKEKEPVTEGSEQEYGDFARVTVESGGPLASLVYKSEWSTTFKTSVAVTAGVTAAMVNADFEVTAGVESSSKIGYELTSDPVDENHIIAMYSRPIYTHKWGHYRQWGGSGLISENIGTFNYTKQDDPVIDWYFEFHESPKPIADLSASLSAPSPVNSGDTFTVRMTVSNAGGSATANNVAPSSLSVNTLTGDASAKSCGGHSPTSANISGGSSQDFTRTCTASGEEGGTLKLSASASGTDANTGETVTASSTTSNTVTVEVPEFLFGLLIPLMSSVLIYFTMRSRIKKR